MAGFYGGTYGAGGYTTPAPTDTKRTFRIVAEARTLSVKAETRTLTVEAP